MKINAIAFLLLLACAVVSQPLSAASGNNVSLPKGIPNTPQMNSYMNNLSTMQNSYGHLVKRKSTKDFSFFGSDNECAAENTPSLAQNLTMSYAFARYSAAAYCVSDLSLESWNCDSHCEHPATRGTEDVQVYDNLLSGTKYYVGVNPSIKSILIIFRGTLNPMSLFADADFLYSSYTMHPKAPSFASVHSGFLDAYIAVSEDLLNRVTTFVKAYPDYDIAIGGHSMGGSLATLAALHMDASNVVPTSRIEIFTYGQPRTGNTDFTNFVSTLGLKSITRVTYNNDLVPRLPPQFIGYEHHRSEIYLTGYLEKDVTMNNTDVNGWDLALGWLVSGSEKMTSRVCQDGCGEDPKCMNGIYSIGTILTHLRVWDVVFGPWC